MARRRILLRTLAIPSLAVLLSGCFLDEIDKSVNANKGKAEALAPKAPGAVDAPQQVAVAKPGAPAAPQGPSWWETAKSLGSEESGADIVGCGINGRTEFMTREDCAARGGQLP